MYESQQLVQLQVELKNTITSSLSKLRDTGDFSVNYGEINHIIDIKWCGV